MINKNTTINWTEVENTVQAAMNRSFHFTKIDAVSGGDIHSAFRVTDNTRLQSLFIKVNHRDSYLVFDSESESLQAISKTECILTPTAITQGQTEKHSFLVMEYLDLSSHGEDYQMGQHLAKLHQSRVKPTTQNQNVKASYGFANDNFIGLTPQQNAWNNNWCDFWVEQRLQPQLQRAYQQGFKNEIQQLESKLYQATKKLLENHQPQASLVHGDLWSGNKGFHQQTPVIFDPACYFADREVDIAMTELFGGFSNEFYQGYNDTWPLDKDYQQRKNLYNLYHILNHLNLFGAGYLSQAQKMILGIIG